MNPQTIDEMESNMRRLNAMLQDRIARGSAIGSQEVAAAMAELAKAIVAYRAEAPNAR